MRDDLKLAVIGGGRMGEALISGFISSELMESSQIAVAEIDEARREALSARFGVDAFADGPGAVRGADVVLLSVKPQQIDEVARGLADSLADAAIVISIAAGVTCARLEGLLGAERQVVRVMPNQAAVVGLAVSAISPGSKATDEAVELSVELMGSVGKTVVVDETLQNAATALSGSGPAYVYLFADCLIEAGVRHGLAREQATELVVGTLQGAAEMLAHGGHPADLIDAVASPGGTTVAALDAFEKGGLSETLSAGVDAAVRRAVELG